MTQVRFDKDFVLDVMKEDQARARLWAWRDSIDKLIVKYGKDATMFVDSGGNSSQFVIETGEEE